MNTYKPTNDYMFKRIFGHKKNADLLKDLLEGILPDIKIASLEVKQQVSLEKEIMSDKLGILDVVATLDDGTIVNIEMQVKDFENTVDRSLFYEAGLFHESLKVKQDYAEIPKVIGIWIMTYDIFDEGPFHERARLRRDYEDILLTDKFELHYIQLPKFKRKCKRISSKLDEWLTFIINNNLEEISMINNEYVKKAEEELEYLNGDEKERELARLREKAIRDEAAAIAGATKRGREAGLAEGIAKGVVKGAAAEKVEIAKKMLKENIEIDIIVKITGLSRKEIENL